MTADQGALFGDVDGLFAPPMIECTPLALVELVPGDHVETMRGLEGSPATAERIRAYEAGRAERLHEIEQDHDERYPVDEWDEHPCPTFKAESADPWCTLCGWEAEDHKTTPCEACSGPMWPGIDHDCPVPADEWSPAAVEEWRNRHDPRNDGPDLSHLPRHRWNAGMWSDAQHDGGCADLAHRWAERTPPAHVDHAATDLFSAADLDAGTCESPTCDRPATHAARFEHFESKEDGWTPAGAVITYGGMRCCLTHANYYAEAWLPIYPGQFGAAWIDILTRTNEQGA